MLKVHVQMCFRKSLPGLPGYPVVRNPPSSKVCGFNPGPGNTVHPRLARQHLSPEASTEGATAAKRSYCASIKTYLVKKINITLKKKIS